MESRTRTVDVAAENYYSFLYSHFIDRGEYQKAATCMYEMVLRIRKETGGVDGLRRQVHNLAACLTTLQVADGDHHWIERSALSVEMDTLFGNGGSSVPIRPMDLDETISGPGGNPERIDIKEIKRDYVLARSTLALAERGACTPALLQPKELVKLLMKNNLFDLAVDVTIWHDLPLADVIDCLAIRCVQSDKRHADRDFDDQQWTWLRENRAICTINTESSRGYPWLMLQAYLDQLTDIVPRSVLYARAMRRLLSLSHGIPQWFINEFKKVDFPELIRLLIEYDQLVDAQRLICMYVDSALGLMPEEFNLQATLASAKPNPIWLPYASIDSLFAILSEKRDAESSNLRLELEEKIKYYFNQLDVQMQAARKK